MGIGSSKKNMSNAMDNPQVAAAVADINSGKESGFVKVVLKEGNGTTPQPGAQCEMHYTGSLTNGKVFDSSRTKQRTFRFQVGVGQVIKGWDEGVVTMKKGEQAILICASGHAYGPGGIPGVIPPAATLIFDVELLNFQ
ncbi:hypothetical protein SARC_09525 [Sphaeroforma arctica JP610]|uniref:peptidylprolyl isomerase n=1 Tax=Sphaeroforma arctica JP610 TaxID=667725 RepID=A0A0L0FNI0_9EUKA|nr:hypothetical protein SARC_09525 [Sphaeroforma arctica JP610]KNC78031.1 hypothetical protein SARC_09525 [Sphaeroforma arctica JP610]|eukprot:XP_014151933.1 hypothetical protein SARC_09525 [Sphaeroforma arctica JP610]